MANITIDELPIAVGLDGTEYIPITKNTGFGYVTEKTTTANVAEVHTNGQYILVGEPPFLPNARIATGASGQISLTDGGAGAAFTFGLAPSGAVAGTYGDTTHVVQLTVDQFGRITAISNVSVSILFQAYLQSLPHTLPAQPNLPWWNGGVLSLS